MADKDFVAEFGSFREVLDGCASHVSEEGIYFETTEAGVVGSDVAFEVRIRDSFTVLRGEGEIVQTTDEGIFLRLAYLDQPSLKLLPKLIEHYQRRGVPLLELPEVETVEAAGDVESLAAAQLDIVEEPTVDDLPVQEETRSPAPPMGLTLNDLEAEFLTAYETDDKKEELGSGTHTEPGTVLVDATEVEIRDDTMGEAGIGTGVDAEGGTEAEAEPLLVDPEELISDTFGDQGEFAPDDIHLDELLTDEEAAEESKVVATAADASLEELPVDAGLPWLPAEPEKQSRKDLWVILLLIALGALLGAAFYFFFLRPQDTGSWKPAAPEAVQAQALPAASPTVEPTPITAESSELPPDVEPEPTPVAPRPRSHDPPGDPLTRVERITWANEAGETVITLWGDGLFVAEQVDDFRVVGGAPREVVRIRGIRRPFPQQRIELDTDHVRRIRVGLHEGAADTALHFVADLVDGDVELLRTEAVGEQLRVYFSKAS